VLINDRRLRHVLPCGSGRGSPARSAAAGGKKELRSSSCGWGQHSGKPMTIGTTDKVVALDPALLRQRSLMLETQVYHT